MRALYMHPHTGEAYSVTDDAAVPPRSVPSSSSTFSTALTSYFARARAWLNSIR
jgi:hypothetical protein